MWILISFSVILILKKYARCLQQSLPVTSKFRANGLRNASLLREDRYKAFLFLHKGSTFHLGMHQDGRTGCQSDWLPVGLSIQPDWVSSRTGHRSDWVPVGLGIGRTGCQSDWASVGLGASRTGHRLDWVPVGLGIQSDWVTGPTGYPVRLSRLLVNIC